ncbi:MAG: hypothetical protein K2X63_02165, partial [Burkholderiaceae bacterium]|nr:hypothetical protein [Burkholderiaceae bacterium]
DKGFDPLLRYLNQNGLKCERIDSLSKPEPKPAKTAKPENANYERVFALLKKAENKSRPRQRATLSKHISAMFQRNIAQSDVDNIINMLLSKKMISESNNIITYLF